VTYITRKSVQCGTATTKKNGLWHTNYHLAVAGMPQTKEICNANITIYRANVKRISASTNCVQPKKGDVFHPSNFLGGGS